MEKTDLESLLKKMIDSGVDISQYRKLPTQLLVPPHLLMAAQKIFEEQAAQRHEIEVDFDE
jgi:hypothetical protein